MIHAAIATSSTDLLIRRPLRPSLQPGIFLRGTGTFILPEDRCQASASTARHYNDSGSDCSQHGAPNHRRGRSHPSPELTEPTFRRATAAMLERFLPLQRHWPSRTPMHRCGVETCLAGKRDHLRRRGPSGPLPPVSTPVLPKGGRCWAGEALWRQPTDRADELCGLVGLLEQDAPRHGTRFLIRKARCVNHRDFGMALAASFRNVPAA
jgi:hypothetical protein